MKFFNRRISMAVLGVSLGLVGCGQDPDKSDNLMRNADGTPTKIEDGGDTRTPAQRYQDMGKNGPTGGSSRGAPTKK